MDLIEDETAQADWNALQALRDAVAQRDLYQSLGLTDLLPNYEKLVIDAYMDWFAAAQSRARSETQSTGYLAA